MRQYGLMRSDIFMKKILKSLLSAVLAVCISASLTVLPVSAGGAEQKGTYEYQKTLLQSLGILSFEIEDSEAPISRGQFTDMAMRTCYKELPSYEKAETFTDVIPNYEFKDAVEAAYANGYIQGIGNNMFGVDMNMTPRTAVIVMLRILNYGEYIKAFGTNEDNYLEIASKIKLTRSVNLFNPELSFKEAVQLIYNAIDIAPLSISKGISSSITYEKNNNTTLIYEKLGIDQAEGIVTAGFYVSLDGSGGLGEDNVKIDDTIYHAGKSGAEDYIGYHVKIYFDEDSKEIYHIEDDDSDLTFISDYAINNGGDLSLKDNILYYRSESGSRKSVNIGTEALIVYNGALVRGGDFDESLFHVDSGTITVIKKSYNNHTVVIIESYTDMVFDRCVEDDNAYILINKFDSNKAIIIPDIDRFSIKDASGNTMDLKSIPSGAVISAALALDETSGKLIVNTEGNKLTQAYVTSGGYDSVTIKLYNESEHTYNEKEYDYSKSFEKINSEKNIVKPSQEYTAYIDAFGRIAYMDSDKDMSDFYAYIIKVFPADDDPESDLMIRMFTEDGKVGEYKVSDNMIIDGISCKKLSNDKIKELLIGNDTSGDPAQFTKSRLAYISLTFDSEVKKVDTCPEEVDIDDKGNPDCVKMKAEREGEDTLYRIDSGIYTYAPTTKFRQRYSSETKSFDTGLLLTSNTKILAIPRDSTDVNRFKIITTASLLNDRLYKVKGYSRDDDAIAADVVLFYYYSRYSDNKDTAEQGSSSSVMVANLPFERSYDADTGICTKCNEEVNPDTGDVETAVTITNIRSGAATTYYTDDKALTEGVKSGQLIRYYVLAGELCYLEPIYDIPGHRFYTEGMRIIKWATPNVMSYNMMHDGNYLSDNNSSTQTENPVYGVGRGVIIKKSANHLAYATYDNYLAGNISDEYLKSYMCTTAKVFHYNEWSRSLEIKNFSDLVAYNDSNLCDEVVIITKNKTTLGIIVY